MPRWLRKLSESVRRVQIESSHPYERLRREHALRLVGQMPTVPKLPLIEQKRIFYMKYYLERMTYSYRTDGQEMYPTLGGPMQTLLVRKLPSPVATDVSVWDVLVLKDPSAPSNHLVRRLAAVGGDFMESSDDKGESFLLENKQCWVLSDNDDITAEEAHDSRTFGPVPISDLVGRVIYGLQSPFDHNPIENSEKSMEEDDAILDVELDVNEMVSSSFSYSMKAA